VPDNFSSFTRVAISFPKTSYTFNWTNDCEGMEYLIVVIGLNGFG
jgi:hypothetical protein